MTSLGSRLLQQSRRLVMHRYDAQHNTLLIDLMLAWNTILTHFVLAGRPPGLRCSAGRQAGNGMQPAGACLYCTVPAGDRVIYVTTLHRLTLVNSY